VPDFGSRVALVTGGASGIGLAVVRALRERGAYVLVADLPDSAGRAVAAQLGAAFHPTDVRDPQANLAAVDRAEREYGRLDFVHLNAGTDTGEAALEDLDVERYRAVVDVNVDGVVFGLRAALPALRRAGGGAVVVTASLGGLLPVPVDPVYAMTKHAVVGLVRSVAPGLAAQGIRVNAVCPSFTDTPLARRYAARLAGTSLLPPQRVAEAVLAAASARRGGRAYVVAPGREVAPFRFGLLGPRRRPVPHPNA
jgi:NAD(P)-dependent dehydrogenase (short-subunit alcohol dehydrogenase family)